MGLEQILGSPNKSPLAHCWVSPRLTQAVHLPSRKKTKKKTRKQKETIQLLKRTIKNSRKSNRNQLKVQTHPFVSTYRSRNQRQMVVESQSSRTITIAFHLLELGWLKVHMAWISSKTSVIMVAPDRMNLADKLIFFSWDETAEP